MDEPTQLEFGRCSQSWNIKNGIQMRFLLFVKQIHWNENPFQHGQSWSGMDVTSSFL